MYKNIIIIAVMFLIGGCSSADIKSTKLIPQNSKAKYPQTNVKNASYSNYGNLSSVYKDEVDLRKFKIDAPAKDISSWRVTYQLREIRFSGNSITFDTDAMDNWRAGDPLKTGKSDLVGNAWIVDFQTGKATTWEWLRKGQKTKGLNNINKILKPGGTYGFFVSTFARNHMRSTNERTNVLVVRV